ncbi:MAG: hypothetical protein KF829_10995 [Ferruginibacter sp.]|nr:hypothetical protein [Ferruginibacter sp.]
MNLRIPLILFLLLQTLISFSQNKSILIADSEDKTPLPYATIKVVNSNKGFHSNRYGVVNLKINELDTLLVEYSGYSKRNVVIHNSDTIFLERKINMLPEVVVTKMRERQNVGTFKYSTHNTLVFTTSMEYAIKIDLTQIKKTYKIEKVFLPVKLNKRIPNLICKLHIYKADDKGMPSDELLEKPIILKKEYFLNASFFVDISEQNIITSEEILFLGVECFYENISKETPEIQTSNNHYNSPIRLFYDNETHPPKVNSQTFYRIFDRKNYNWIGNENSSFPPNFCGGLVILY